MLGQQKLPFLVIFGSPGWVILFYRARYQTVVGLFLFNISVLTNLVHLGSVQTKYTCTFLGIV